MKTYYRVCAHWTDIVPVEVDRETETSVWVKGARNNRMSSFYSFFPTYEEAYETIKKRLEKNVMGYEYRLEEAKQSLNKFLEEVKPTL